LESTPRDPSLPLQIQCIPDGNTLSDDSDPDIYRQWPDDNGINILGTPLGSPVFIEAYLFGKGIKHRVLLNFIQEVAAAGFLKGGRGDAIGGCKPEARLSPQVGAEEPANLVVDASNG
jgi:hypothetical protein